MKRLPHKILHIEFKKMLLSGWITMTLVVGAMTALLVWCSWKVMSTPDSAAHIHSVELDTPDQHENV